MADSSSRREFLGALAGALAVAPQTLAMQSPGPAGIPSRPLGRTGASVSSIGYGGWDCAIGDSDAACIARMHEAIDSGITFFDNAWEYHAGRAEELMGRALEGRRERVFLMTKVCARDYVGARRQIEESLRRLRTDRLDLLLFHAVQYDEDPGTILDAEKGALRAALEAQGAGKTRFLGFSGHRKPQTHLEMIGRREWDAVQMPLNLLDAQYSSFEKAVLPVCREKKIGALGMKSLAGQDGRLPREGGVDVELCRRYAMSLPVSTTICGMQTVEELRQMVRIGRGFVPLTTEAVASLLGKTKMAAGDGRIEVYKNPKGGYGCSYHDAVRKAGA